MATAKKSVTLLKKKAVVKKKPVKRKTPAKKVSDVKRTPVVFGKYEIIVDGKPIAQFKNEILCVLCAKHIADNAQKSAVYIKKP